MFSVKVGTTNLDGTGSATNLSPSNEILSEINSSGSGSDATAISDADTITATATSWNAAGAKELKIDAIDTNVVGTDFVDVDINSADSTSGIDISLYNSKRGEVETGSGSDSVHITVQSNSANWDNTFVVNTNAGDDSIIFENSENSQFTHLDIDAGSGDDIIDISALNANSFSADGRILDGGSGDDTITGSDGNETIIGGSGDDVINAGGGDDIIQAGSGDDVIDAGDGDDIIQAGSGDDTVIFDAADSIVNGGSGLDALIVSGTVNLDNVVSFEAIIGASGSDEIVEATLTDGLIVSLGGDAGDALSFDNVDSFALSTDAVLSSEMTDYADSHSIDVGSLVAYESNDGDIVWTDVDLLT